MLYLKLMWGIIVCNNEVKNICTHTESLGGAVCV